MNSRLESPVGVQSVLETDISAATADKGGRKVLPESGPRKSVALSDFSGPEVQMSLALANLAIGRLHDQFESVKVREGLNREAQRAFDKRLLEQMKAIEKSEKSGLLSKIFGWIGKILALVVSAVAVAATGAAASPVMAAALVLALYDVAASAAMEAKPGLHIGLADGLGKFVGLLAKACGANDEEVKQAEQWGGMALALVVQLGICAAALAPNAASRAVSKAGDLLSALGKFFINLGTQPGRVVGESLEALSSSPMLGTLLKRLGANSAERAPLLGEAALEAASSSTRSASGAVGQASRQGAAADGAAATSSAELMEGSWAETAKWMRVALKLQGPVSALQGATAITSGALGIKAGVDQYHSAQAEADAVEANALINYLNAFFEKEKQELEVAARDVGTIIKKIGEMIDLEAETETAIAANFAPMLSA